MTQLVDTHLFGDYLRDSHRFARTLGGVVSQPQPLMMIVPQEDSLEVEAFIDNVDIGFVKAGQEAAVKVETFQYTKYRLVDATVTSVIHDAINDEKRGLIYSTRVRMNRTNISVDGIDEVAAQRSQGAPRLSLAISRQIHAGISPCHAVERHDGQAVRSFSDRGVSAGWSERRCRSRHSRNSARSMGLDR